MQRTQKSGRYRLNWRAYVYLVALVRLAGLPSPVNKTDETDQTDRLHLSRLTFPERRGDFAP